jgi:hypothetical protein
MTGSEYLKQKSHSPLLLCSSSSLNSTPSLRGCIQTLSLSEMCVGGHPVCVSVIDRVIRLRYYMGVCLIRHTSPINCCHPFESTKEQHKVLDRSFAKWQHHSISGARPLPGAPKEHGLYQTMQNRQWARDHRTARQWHLCTLRPGFRDTYIAR